MITGSDNALGIDKSSHKSDNRHKCLFPHQNFTYFFLKAYNRSQESHNDQVSRHTFLNDLFIIKKTLDWSKMKQFPDN